METLFVWAAAQGAKALNKVTGPNGAFISITLADDSKITIPVGNKSQSGKLSEYNILVTEDGQAIATLNSYTTVESYSFAPFTPPGKKLRAVKVGG